MCILWKALWLDVYLKCATSFKSISLEDILWPETLAAECVWTFFLMTGHIFPHFYKSLNLSGSAETGNALLK